MGSLELQDYFITPIQRLPRYMLLLDMILKKMSDEHPDKKDLEEALIAMRGTVNFVNDSIKSNEKMVEFTNLVNKGKLKVTRATQTHTHTQKNYSETMRSSHPHSRN
jgi:hypothetical protein